MDYSYFRTFFEMLDLYGSNKLYLELHYYPGKYELTKEKDNIGKLVNLLITYSRTLGNQYENSIVDKLVLEDRLSVVSMGKVREYDEIENKMVNLIKPVNEVNYINNYLNKWGELVHGVFNFSDKDKLVSTDGMNIIFNDDTCYYYTGITSVGSDESLVGFTLTNTRTGETTMYKTSGATEYASMKSAQGKVQQYGYTATFPYLINIQSEPTYFMTLKDANGLVKQYAMVNVKNYNTVAVGDTLQTTLNRYIENLTSSNISLEGSNSEEVVKGEIERIGLVIKDGASIYDLKIKGEDSIFTVSTETSRQVALSNIGDMVEISFIRVGNGDYIISNSFKNVTLEGSEKGNNTEENNSEEKVQQ